MQYDLIGLLNFDCCYLRSSFYENKSLYSYFSCAGIDYRGIVLMCLVFDVACRYFFCEKCYLSSHSDVMEVVDNPTRPPMYVVRMSLLYKVFLIISCFFF